MTEVEWPTTWARLTPERAAVIDVRDDSALTYAALEDRSRALAHALADWGLEPGDHVALAVANRLQFYEACWAAHRIGLYYTAVNTHLTADEARYTVTDCGARVVIVDDELPMLADALAHDLPGVEHRIAIGAPRPGHLGYEALVDRPTGPLDRECEGEKMLYTSGTTGLPKGVARPLTAAPPGEVHLIRPLLMALGFDGHSTLANFGPLYHSAPLGYGMGMHRLGATVLIGGRFDAEASLAAIARHRATHGLFVPTMLARMLRVADRERFDVSSLRAAIHGAAPCPESVKRAMIEWWGPVLFEYYGATEGAGMTVLDTEQWLAHPGSVGHAVGSTVHIVDEGAGVELDVGETGAVYFSGGTQFEYHNDPEKTAAAYGINGWNTTGDIGHLDEDGYLYLSDRKSFMVISGGVNIYPQEAENVLAGHPAILDVAAFGVPDPDLGERLVALAQLADPSTASPQTAAEILAWGAERLARHKLPRRLEFVDRLPRAENGKLYKRELIERWS